MATKQQPAAMLQIGNSPGTLQAASAAIVEVLKAAGTEGAQVAAVNCLAEIARAPQNTTISGNTFEAGVGGKR